MVMTCQYRFISYNKCPTLVGDFDNGEVFGCVGTGDIWEIYVPSVQFCSGPKTFFFFKVYLIRERVKQKPHHLLWPNPQIGKLQPVDQIWPST